MSSIFASGRARSTALVVALGMGALLLIWLVAWWLIPVVVKSQLEKRASEVLGRTVTVGQVDFWPWTLELTLHDLAVAYASGTSPQLEIKRLYIDLELQSLVRLAPVVDAIQIDGPFFRWAQTAPGRYDIDDVLERLAARSPPSPAPAEPTRVAFYNITLSGGAMDFEDRAAGRTQSVRQLNLAVPFLSTLAAHREVTVTPRLAFELNGSAFQTTAQATPFATGHRADVHLHVKQLDLAPFAAHLPAAVPLRLRSGLLDADLRLSFEQAEQASVSVTGSAALQDVRFLDRQDRDVLAFDTLRVQLRDVQPLKRVVQLGAVEWSGLRAELRRNADGALDLPGLAPASGARSSALATPTATTPAGSWQIEVNRLTVRDARVGWIDHSVGGARWEARRVHLVSSDIAWPLQRPLHFQADAEVAGDAALAPAARLSLAGQATGHSASAALSVHALPLELAAPYLSAYLQPRLSGAVDADLGMAWNGPARVVKVAKLTVSAAALACGDGAAPCSATLADAGMKQPGKGRLFDLQRLTVEDAWVRLHQRAVSVGRVSLSEPRTVASRNAQGRWMFEDWWVSRPAASVLPPPTPQGPPAASSSSADVPWTLQLNEAVVEGGALAFRDESAGKQVAIDLSSLQVRLRDFAPLAQAGSAPLSALNVSARVGSGRFEPGRLSYEGALRMAPLQLQGKVQASHLPLQAFEPYIADRLNVRIMRAEGSFSGDVRHAQTERGASTTVQGDVVLEEVRVRDAGVNDGARSPDVTAVGGGGGRDDLVRWKSLGLRGVSIAALPGQPLSLEVRETSLTDFFARVVLQESGRLNLQEVLKAAPPPASTAAPAGANADAGAVDAPILRFGPITLSGGSVQFSDRFVKPNYSADITELAGRLSAFSSAPAGESGQAQMADLELRGKAEGTAAVEIVGKLNPLAQPLALDIKGRMRDLDLPPLSPYSVKYAGHGIERGKLTMDVNYKVLPSGELTASNRLVLRQLAFGDPVEGAPASLPVRLAVALLADRNGVIDVELPISGSLNDPQFSLGAVIWRVIGNLVMKAITSPFSLLGGAFGGSEDLGLVEFAPGSAVLTPQARTRLDTVAQAMTDRPALNMTVVGEAALEAEREAWKRQRLQELVQSEKRRTAAQAGQGAEQVTQVPPVSEAEHPQLLEEAYRRADIAKPRNLVGMAKNLPASDMEGLLLANIPVPADAMRSLAIARGVAVRDYLAERAVTVDRLFVGAPRVDVSGESWVPRASLSLERR